MLFKSIFEYISMQLNPLTIYFSRDKQYFVFFYIVILYVYVNLQIN